MCTHTVERVANIFMKMPIFDICIVNPLSKIKSHLNSKQVVYTINRSDCDAFHIGHIRRYFEVRYDDHIKLILTNKDLTTKKQVKHTSRWSRGSRSDI